MTINVAIVDDSEGICEELEHVISDTPDLACVCVCRNAAIALKRIPAARPDVVIMDIHLPDESGIKCTARLKRLLPETQVLMFTIQEDPEIIVKALEAGASGYLLKGAEATDIAAAVHELAKQGAPMSREVARKLVESFHRSGANATEGEQLTLREEEILGLMAKGFLYKEIADQLSIKLDTVGTHVKSIFRKLHVRTRTEAVVKYLS